MDTPSRPRAPYWAAAFPLVLSVGQVVFASAPMFMLWIGAGLSLAVFLVLWFGAIWLQRARPQFGKAVVIRAWQAPVLWVPVAVAIVILLFYGFSA